MPDTMIELCDSILNADSQSSLLTKADPELRKQLIDALITRKPYTYRAVFEHYELAQRGISFTAFYYWARRVRRNAALVEMARSCNTDSDNDPVRLVPRVVGQRLLDACLDEDIGIEIIDRLSRSYFMVNRVEYLRARLPRLLEENQAPPAAAPSSPDESAPDLATLERLTSLYVAATKARVAEVSKECEKGRD